MLRFSLVILVCGIICVDSHKVTNVDTIQQARELVFNFLNDTGNEFLPGLVIGVSVAGEEKWVEGFGLANIENNVTMSGEAVMQIGSITKSFTVGLAARLVEEAKLDFDVPISNYLTYDEFPDKTWNGSVVNITLRQLLQMTAGIPNGPSTVLEVGVCLRCLNQKDRLVMMRDRELDFEPDTDFNYSNLGYELAGAVIESVLGNETFDDALTEMIQDVLELNRTSIVNSQHITPNLASFYMSELISPILASFLTINNDSAGNGIYNSGMWGEIFLNDFHAAGGVIATMKDLLKYGQIWLDAYYGRSEKFLKQSTVEDVWTTCNVCTPTIFGAYGLGWVIQNRTTDRPSGNLLVWHNGGTLGCTSVLAIYPESEVIVAASVNLANIPVDVFVLDGKIADLFAANVNVSFA